ncbi:hypothetical protein [Dickeya chrysanthemi]|uniref:Uncharacterized protein n=1 Tax=Dickeya chrysanthemi TaxID=556 RepID=A0ABU8JI86_DICCH|nr:hypothetical protein [Dickeya chrysanthemi]MBX9446267.1 hypothetical protein [Dickeya chrysanthemi]MCA7006675.1 hypothetical protein [Dickeya chrysanthemi]
MMNKRNLIAKAGLSRRELLVLKKNYMTTKENPYRKSRNVKAAESLREYIFLTAYSCWDGIVITIALCLFFAIGDYLEDKFLMKSLKVFSFLFIVMMICFIKSKNVFFKISMKMTLKLMFLRVMLLFYPME